MNGRNLALGAVAALALARAVRRRGSAATVGRLDPEGLRYDKRLALAARAQLAARGVTVPAPTTGGQTTCRPTESALPQRPESLRWFQWSQQST
jgi:hypothetical protein